METAVRYQQNSIMKAMCVLVLLLTVTPLRAADVEDAKNPATGAANAMVELAPLASDHADPIDLLRWKRLEAGITDLFVFPVTKDNQPAHPFARDAKLPLHDTLADVLRTPLTDDDLAEVDALVFVLCVRRQLTDSKTLTLEPFTYRIHIDTDSVVEFPKAEDVEADAKAAARRAPYGSSGYSTGTGSPEKQKRPTLVEAFARYGGRVKEPSKIREDITMEFRFTNKAALATGYPKYTGAAASGWDPEEIPRVAGVFDDPFIFPSFFGTNVVAVVVRVPIEYFPEGRQDLLIWAKSYKGDSRTPIDHVGRSLRTQNPRFELLNPLHPSKHVAAIEEEHEHPSLMRDLGLRFNLASLFAYRSWDFVPDVMCYSNRFPVGFPNGRLLTDDVAAILAQHGDTLLYELSYQDNNGRWPRQMTNDGLPETRQFQAEFPYLNPPLEDRPQPPPPGLSTENVWKLIGILLAVLLFFAFTHWLFAVLYHRRKLRRRYL